MGGVGNNSPLANTENHVLIHGHESSSLNTLQINELYNQISMDNEKKIIGGVFGLSVQTGNGALPDLFNIQHLCMANARSAIRLLVDFISPRTIWIPAYICRAVTQALADHEFRFYPVDPRLEVEDDAWLAEVKHEDIVLVVDYFGFHHDPALSDRARNTGAIVVEDACQAFLTTGIGEKADYLIVSPRKFFGLPDGGVLCAAKNRPLPSTPLISPPLDWQMGCMLCGSLRTAFDTGNADRSWFPLFQRMEDSAPIGPYSMSLLAKRLMTEGLNVASAAQARRTNYNLLLEKLGHVALYPTLPDGVVPLCFPIILPNRESVQKVLYAADIFPPVHWPLQGVVPDSYVTSHQISQRQLSLVCDQRYDREDMAKTADMVLSMIQP